jgi:hypothetical protein
VTFGNDVEAKTFGNAVWYTFGRSTLKNIVRPFGNVIVDGFDFGKQFPFISRLIHRRATHSKQKHH